MVEKVTFLYIQDFLLVEIFRIVLPLSFVTEWYRFLSRKYLLHRRYLDSFICWVINKLGSMTLELSRVVFWNASYRLLLRLISEDTGLDICGNIPLPQLFVHVVFWCREVIILIPCNSPVWKYSYHKKYMSVRVFTSLSWFVTFFPNTMYYLLPQSLTTPICTTSRNVTMLAIRDLRNSLLVSPHSSFTNLLLKGWLYPIQDIWVAMWSLRDKYYGRPNGCTCK